MDNFAYTVNCSILLTDLPLLQRPQAARDAGFDAVEFWWPFDTSAPSDGDVDAFVAAWPTGDADQVASFFSNDAVYHNGPLPRVQGRDAIRTSIAEMMTMGGEVDVDIVHLVADGDVVLTERVDYFRTGGKSLSLAVMGTFEVRNGLIVAWRDYFDLNQFTSQLRT